MTDELKPCPFCGGVGHIHKDPDMNWGDFYSVKCSKCRAKSGEFHAAETCPVFYGQVRDAWNTRADLEATASPSIASPLDDPRVKALVEALRDMTALAIQLGAIDLETRDALAALSALEESK